MSDAPMLAAVITASVALLVGLVTVVQKWRSDAREAWWTRAEWAIDKSLSENADERDIGSRAIFILATRDKRLTDDTDMEVLKAAVLRAAMDTA